MALTDEQLEIISEALLPLFQYLEKEVIIDVANRIKKSLAYTRTAELKAESMQRMGYSPVQIRKEALKLLNSDAEFQKMVAENTHEHKQTVKSLLKEIYEKALKEKDTVLAESANAAFQNDVDIWKQGGMELANNSFLEQIVEAAREQTKASFKNLTQTTGFKTVSGFEPVENLYRRELDKAMIKVCTGTYTQEEVIYDVIHSLADSGLRSIDYGSGKSMQLDTAVRLAMRTGAHQMEAKVTDENIKRTGVNLVRVSKHWGARNTGIGHANHEQWQGKVYFIKEGNDYSEESCRIGQDCITSLWYATGYSVDGAHENDPLGLNGYNCRHRHYAWFEGISELPDEDPEPQPVTINGKTYDYYAATQKMRSMERGIRALKREREALSVLGDDTTEIQAKIRKKIADYHQFCADAGINAKDNRLRYEAGISDLKKTKAWKGFEVSVPPSKKEIADSTDYATMSTAKEEKVVDVHTVGKIDKDIYKCITEDIVTDEVIITDERIQHIKERHPEDYERFCSYIPEIIANPDYIIEANKPSTAVVLKEFEKQGEKFKLVLRIAVKSDPKDYKNSVISFWYVGDTTRKKTIKNKNVLYRKE